MALEMSSLRVNDELVRLGKYLVSQLFILFKTSQNYSEGHGALDPPVANVIRVVREIQRKNEEAALRVKGNYLYLGDLRLKPDATGYHTFNFVMEEMTRHGIGGICFNLSASLDDLRRFVYSFREVELLSAPDSYGRILERMQQRMITGIELEALAEELARVQIDRELSQDYKLKAKRLYQKAMDAMSEVMKTAAAGKPLRLREPKRVVQQMIDLLANDQSCLIAHTALRSPESQNQSHAARVCILSLALGRRLGLPKFTLCELGLAALLHDIGTVDLAGELLDQPVALTAAQKQTLEAHPLVGVKKIMQLKMLDTLSSRIITGVFEHHLLADFSGYPRFPYQRLSLFGRIISIADGYAGLTSLRVSGRAPYAPEKAVRYLLSLAGKAYDEALLKLFIGCVGLYPIGTLLQLDGGGLAVVVGNNPEPAEWCHPRVKIIADPAGSEVDGEIVDLAHPDSGMMITGSLDPQRYQLDVGPYLL